MTKYDGFYRAAAATTTLMTTRSTERVMTLFVYVMHYLVVSTGGQ